MAKLRLMTPADSTKGVGWQPRLISNLLRSTTRLRLFGSQSVTISPTTYFEFSVDEISGLEISQHLSILDLYNWTALYFLYLEKSET